MTERDYDAAIIGGSLAGCATAILLARAGLRIALVEKHSDPDAYKRLCGHFIQASATATLQRLDLDGAIEAAGGVRNSHDIWTRWGWIAPRTALYGYSIRRAKLDPLIRTRAVEAPGVTYFGGQTAVALIDGGVRVRDRAGRETVLRAPLVVGADGRNSTVGKLAGAAVRRRPNNRFCYIAYFEGVDAPEPGRARVWQLEPDVFITAPNDDGLTLMAAFPHKRRLEAFKADREGAFAAMAAEVHEPLRDARRVSPLIGFTDYPAVVRPPVPRRGVALVGDAALTCDPLLAIGCGWALQSAEWLADAVVPGLLGDEPLDACLRRYRRRHRRELAGHARMLDAGARAKPLNPIERLMFRAATRDAATAHHLERFVTRSMPVRRFLAPSAIGRAAWVNATAR